MDPVTPSGLTLALASFSEIWTAAVGMITDNAYLMIFLVAGLIGTAFRIFKRAKKAVR